MSIILKRIIRCSANATNKPKSIAELSLFAFRNQLPKSSETRQIVEHTNKDFAQFDTPSILKSDCINNMDHMRIGLLKLWNEMIHLVAPLLE